MTFDPMRLVVFFHVLLYVYWLGGDLGVMITSIAGNKRGLSAETRRALAEANALIDMAPRTCLVLMIPAGLTLATGWGLVLPIWVLALTWLGGAAWVWLVWAVHLQHGSPLGQTLWKLDLGLRIVATAFFLGFGSWCLATGAPISSHWLATKIVLFGVLILLGVVVRIMLLTRKPTAPPPPPDAEFVPKPFFTPLRNVVFGIWGLVLVMAFLGIVKPF